MRPLNRKAFSVIEYTVLIVIIIGAFLVLKNYIQRGIYGQWGQSGQSFAFGRQYDSQKTVQCAYDQQLNVWYDHNCFLQKEQNCAIGNAVCYQTKAIEPCEAGQVSGSACDMNNYAL